MWAGFAVAGGIELLNGLNFLKLILGDLVIGSGWLFLSWLTRQRFYVFWA